jgi:Gluconate 2-dehydrogenase subunit 3
MYSGVSGKPLDRRDALRLLALNSLLPAIPAPLFAALREVRASLDAAPGLKALNANQNATVIAMSELIIPETDTPGAKAIRVNEFIDRIVAEWYSDEDRASFLTGLAHVDDVTAKLFGKSFVDASPEQQGEVLRELGDEMTRDAEELEALPRGYRGEGPGPEDNFYCRFRGLTLTGYFTSEVGFTKQLHEEIIPGHYDGCINEPAAEPKKGG